MMAAETLKLTPRLRGLMAGIVNIEPRYDRVLGGVVADSRLVAPGDLFLACRGATNDARDYVETAIARGARAVVYEAPAMMMTSRSGVPLIGVPDLPRWMGTVADRFYRHPSRSMWVAGITGTNGKTSVAHFIAQALQEGLGRGVPCGVLGTLGYGPLGALRPATHTTPDVVTTHRLLGELRDQGIRHAVMEASSHGLEQGRVSQVAFDVAVFTNLTRDHLDYHRDMATYADAKRSLFQMEGLRHAVVNVDDPASERMLDGVASSVAVTGYSLKGDTKRASVVATDLERTPAGLALTVTTARAKERLQSSLLGHFNAANLLAAAATLLALDIPLDEALARLAAVRAVPGRMERFGGVSGRPLVVVDYAHTPDALAQVLSTLQEHCGGEIWCVFGCGGERDRGKRAEMGAVAERAAHRLVLTDDNPRGEDGDAIIRDILAGMKAPAAAVVERRREEAIRGAIASAGSSDVVLVAGKGHEEYQEIAGERRSFSDRAVVGRALAADGGEAG